MIFKNTLKIFLFVILLNGCGYTPIFKNFENLNFSINIEDTIGSRKINNLIISSLNNYSKQDSIKKYNISINTKYTKNIIAKDSTGAATEYKLILNSTFKVTSLNYNSEFNFTESFNMQSMSNKLDEADYEENIQNNLTNIITRKLILKLSQIK